MSRTVRPQQRLISKVLDRSIESLADKEERGLYTIDMDQAIERTFRWMEEIHQELQLPGVTVGTFMNLPGLRHRGKSVFGSKDGESLVVHCPLEIKELLLEAEPEIYFQTDHYKGYPAVLIHPEKINKKQLQERITTAWRMNATKRQISEYEAR